MYSMLTFLTDKPSTVQLGRFQKPEMIYTN